LLDLEGSESATGKSLGTDLAKRKMTLPLIHARDAMATDRRSKYLALLSDSEGIDREALLAVLAHHESLPYARQQARQYAERSLAELVGLTNSPAKDALSAMAEFAIARSS